MIHVETDIRIEHEIDDVFDYVAEPLNLEHWNSAVDAVRAAGAGYRMQRTLPSGEAINELVIDEYDRPRHFAMHTTSGPTPFAYRFDFAPDGQATRVDVKMEADLGKAENLLAPLMRAAVRRGVDDNLATLKGLVEQVTPGERNRRR